MPGATCFQDHIAHKVSLWEWSASGHSDGGPRADTVLGSLTPICSCKASGRQGCWLSYAQCLVEGCVPTQHEYANVDSPMALAWGPCPDRPQPLNAQPGTAALLP
jgi:hypothetical protein